MKERNDLGNSYEQLNVFLNQLGYKVYSELKSLLKKRKMGAKIAIFDQKMESVLLVRHQYRGKNLWYLPGGGVQVGERPDEAIRREVSEEIDVVIEEPALAGIYKEAETKRNLVFLFCCQSEQNVELKSFSEIEEVNFFRLSELPRNLAPGVEERLFEMAKKIREGIIQYPRIIYGEW